MDDSPTSPDNEPVRVSAGINANAPKLYTVTQEVEIQLEALSPADAVARVADRMFVGYNGSPNGPIPRFTNVSAREAY